MKTIILNPLQYTMTQHMHEQTLTLSITKAVDDVPVSVIFLPHKSELLNQHDSQCESKFYRFTHIFAKFGCSNPNFHYLKVVCTHFLHYLCQVDYFIQKIIMSIIYRLKNSSVQFTVYILYFLKFSHNVSKNFSIILLQ